MQIRNAQPPTFAHAAAGPRAFTLIEMMTAIGLLLLIIAGVGIIFKAATGSVSLSQANMEMMSNIRAVQGQIERDIGGLERNGFIVIRSRAVIGADGVTRRFDQLAFLANGSFPNRTGSKNSSPFTDRTVANSARIWYGHPVIEVAGSADQGTAVPLNAVPTGATDKDYILGRVATLLMPSDGGSAKTIGTGGIFVAAFSSIDRAATLAMADMPNSEPGTSITASRIGVAEVTASQVMQAISSAVTTAGGRANAPRYEAENYCYRFKTLPNPYASEVGSPPSLTNAYFRMHPILLPGTPDFSVEWTDGTLFIADDIDPGTGAAVLTERVGTTRWFGYDTPQPASKYGAPGTDPTEPTLANGDDYTAQFSFDNKAKWPKALRIRYRVTDPNNRLSGGRDFTQIIKIPD